MNKDIVKALSMLSQVAITILTPVLLCILFTGWLAKKFGIGTWIIILGAILGVASGFLNLWKLFMSVTKKDEK